MEKALKQSPVLLSIIIKHKYIVLNRSVMVSTVQGWAVIVSKITSSYPHVRHWTLNNTSKDQNIEANETIYYIYYKLG